MARHRRRAPLSVDLSVLGVPELQKRVNSLSLTVAKTLVRKAMRGVLKKYLQPAINANIGQVSPGKFGTGRLKQLKTKIRIYKSKTGFGAQIMTPTREKLGIHGDAAGYYPMVLEKGSSKLGMPPQNMLKRARDQKSAIVKQNLGKEIGNQIDTAVRKLGKKAFR